MDPKAYEAGNQLDADIKKITDDGIALLLTAAKLAAERGTPQAQAFNRFVAYQLNGIQAATLRL